MPTHTVTPLDGPSPALRLVPPHGHVLPPAAQPSPASAMSRRAARRVLQALLSLSLTLLAPELPTSPASSAVLAAEPGPTSSRFDGARVKKDITYLASQELKGRGLGTPELDKAADYLAKQLKDAGLKGAMPDGSFFQPFEIATDVKLGPDNRLELCSPTTCLRLKQGEGFTPLGFSDSKAFEGSLVFGGYGISAPELGYDDYKDIDLKDKVVLVLRGIPAGKPTGPFEAAGSERYGQLRYKAMTAREKGARAILFMDREAGGTLMPLPKGQVTSSAGIASGHLRREDAVTYLKTLGIDLNAAQQSIDSGLKPASSAPAEGKSAGNFSITKTMGKARNVVGWLEGSDPTLKNEVIVIGAHYDHLGLGGESSLAPDQLGVPHVGADDNASGTSGMLELARSYARQPRMKRSLLFIAFSAEESGLGGSAFFTREPLRPLDQTVLMVNMDMIGRMRDQKLSVQGVDTAKGMRERLEPLAKAQGLQVAFTGDGYGPSDHTPFYAKNIPVLFFFTGAHADYHRPSDTAEKIQVEGLLGVLGLASSVLDQVGMEAVRPEYVRLSMAPPPQLEGGGGGRGYGAYLGTVPDFTEGVEGVPLTGVRPGSPAEQAGIQGGDVIIKLAGKTVLNLQDFTFVLRDHKPGDEVEIVVKRAGKELTLRATLGKRQ